MTTTVTVYAHSYAEIDTADYLAERLDTDEISERLDRIYEAWQKSEHAPNIATPEKFVEWLNAIGFQTGGLYGDGEYWSHWTGNEQTMLSDDFSFCMFGNAWYGDYVYIARNNLGYSTAGGSFYCLTGDDETSLVEYTRATLRCDPKLGDAVHYLETEDGGYRWAVRRDDGDLGTYSSDTEYVTLDDLAPFVDADGDETGGVACPVCGAEILHGESF